MVNIYTNENNPATLKLLIAKNLAKQVVDLKLVNVHGELKNPTWEVPISYKFFDYILHV